MIDDALIAELNALAEGTDWTGLGYNRKGGDEFAFYKDVERDGERFRALYFTAYRNTYGGPATASVSQSQQGYATDTVHWFRCDPIEWTLLDPETGLAVANAALDAQAINEADPITTYDNDLHLTSSYYLDEAHTMYLNNYAHSTVREWLNGSFADSAFTDEEKAVIITREIDNSLTELGESYLPYAGENTFDPVFLLSRTEAGLFGSAAARVRPVTDWAWANGVYPYNDDAALWYLRTPTPGNGGKNMNYIAFNGAIDGSADANGIDVAIVPAIYLDLAAYDALNAEEPEPGLYDGLTFRYADGILRVSGSGTVPTADQTAPDYPFADYAGECEVVVLEDGIEGVAAEAFMGFDALSMLIVNGDAALEPDAFAPNGALSAVIAKGSLTLTPLTFAMGAPVRLFEDAARPHTGNAGAEVDALPYSYEDGTLRFDGSATMDTYSLLDLLSVLCGWFDPVNAVRFTSYTSTDVPFSRWDAEKGDYVAVENNTLEGVSFSVKRKDGGSWVDLSFNEFCALAAAGDLGTFRLVPETDAGEEIREPEMSIVDRIISVVQGVLKWIVNLLNQLFRFFSK